MVAELDRSFIRERQKDGIERGTANGVYKGREPTVPVEQVRAIHKDGVGPSAIARELCISRMSAHPAIHGTGSGGARGIPDYARMRRVYAPHRED